MFDSAQLARRPAEAPDGGLAAFACVVMATTAEVVVIAIVHDRRLVVRAEARAPHVGIDLGCAVEAFAVGLFDPPETVKAAQGHEVFGVPVVSLVFVVELIKFSLFFCREVIILLTKVSFAEGVKNVVRFFIIGIGHFFGRHVDDPEEMLQRLIVVELEGAHEAPRDRAAPGEAHSTGNEVPNKRVAHFSLSCCKRSNSTTIIAHL